jgi:hypothetical protein
MKSLKTCVLVAWNSSLDEIKVLLDVEAPDFVALNAGSTRPFPRVHGYVLIPNDDGYIEPHLYRSKSGLQPVKLIAEQADRLYRLADPPGLRHLDLRQSQACSEPRYTLFAYSVRQPRTCSTQLGDVAWYQVPSQTLLNLSPRIGHSNL